jgi:diguanylate cyclase (GGDEF)-like protein/PAS domain S-box-containing protein
VPPAGVHPEEDRGQIRALASGAVRHLDPIILLVAAWAIVYTVAAFAVAGPDVHSLLSDLLLAPIGPVTAILAIRLSRDDRLETRDRWPWRVLAAAGLMMALRDGLSILNDVQAWTAPSDISWLPTGARFALVLAGSLLFRPSPDAHLRPARQMRLDLAGVALAATLLIWYFALAGPAAPGGDLVSALVGETAAVLTIIAFARIAVRPTGGLSTLASTILVLSGGAALGGTVATLAGGPTTDTTIHLGQIAVALTRLGLIVAARMEMKARGRARLANSGRAPSQLFYAIVALGTAPLLLTVFDLGPNYAIVVAFSAALLGLAMARQVFATAGASLADEARRRTEARFGWLVRNSSDLIMAVDEGGALDYVSPSVERLLHLPGIRLIGSALTDLAHPDDVDSLSDLIGRAMASPGLRVSGEWRIRGAEGSWLPVETVASSSTGDSSNPGVVLNTRDLQERKALEQKLTFQAFHDPLTRLANRSLFRERVEHALDRRRASNLAVLFIDLDNFKTINDSLGHAAGDHVLVETAHRIRSTLRPEDTASRLGGDEFAALLEDADVTAAARVAERIRLALGVPFWVVGHEVFISASIGIAVQEDGDAAGDMLRNADVAMYTAKTKGKGRFEIFEPAMHDAVVAHLGLEADLRRAIDREEFVVHYQPIVRLDTSEVIGAEALVRWQHPTRGLVLPAEFIPLAEETGLIVSLGGWILRQACRQLAEWQRSRGGGEPFVMNVNLSSRQLVRDAIADEVAAAIDESGIRASWLVLEVTETAIMADPVAAGIALRHIRDLGVRVALDDFGSGYSSLSHRRRFPIDIVKIDKSFVDDVAGDGAESAIARGIISLDRAMSIQTIAEGIEAGDQARTLRELGCELGQGHFFAEPLTPTRWAELLGIEDIAREPMTVGPEVLLTPERHEPQAGDDQAAA